MLSVKRVVIIAEGRFKRPSTATIDANIAKWAFFKNNETILTLV